QPPINSVPPAQAMLEDASLAFSSFAGNLVSISDADAATSAVQMTLSVTTGFLTLSSTAGLTFTTGDGSSDTQMVFTGGINAINAALDGLVYVPPADANGSVSLVITTNDLGNTGSGGSKSDTDTVGISILPMNDAP